MSSNSLWNPFLFSVFRDPRTFKNDEPSDGNDDKPSGAPAPTVFYNDYSDPNNPVLDTSSAVEDRRSGDGSTSSAYAIANDTNFTPAQTNQDVINEIYASSDSPWETNGAELTALTVDRAAPYTGGGGGGSPAPAVVVPPKVVAPVASFEDTFAANRAAGIGSLRPVSRPTNLLSSREQALVDAYNSVPDDDESYTPDSETMAALLKSQDKTSAIAAPLSVAEQVANYGGADLAARDEANNAAAATAFDNSDFNYTVDTGAGRNLDADLGVGGSSATVSAEDLLNDDIASDNITTYVTPGGGGVTLSDDNARALDQIISGDRTASDLQGANVSLAGVTPATTLSAQDFLDSLPGNDVVADLSGFANYSPQDFLNEAGSGIQLEKSYDAFGTEYATAEQAAQADVDMNNAAVIANNPDFVSGIPGYVPKGLKTLVDTSGASRVADDLANNFVGGGFEEASGIVSGFGNYGDAAGKFLYNAPGNIANNFRKSFDSNAQYQDPFRGTVDPIMDLQGSGAGQVDAALARAASAATAAKYDRPQDRVTGVSEFVSPAVSSLDELSQGRYDRVSEEMQERQDLARLRPGTTLDDLINGRALTVGGTKWGDDKLATTNNAVQEAADVLLDVGATAINPLYGGAAVLATSGLSAGDSSIEGIRSNLQTDYNAGSLQKTPQFQEELQRYGGDEQRALVALQDAAAYGSLPAAFVGALGDRIVASRLAPTPAVLAAPVVSGLTETGEEVLTNVASNRLGTDIDPMYNTGRAFTDGLAGGTVGVAPSAIAQAATAAKNAGVLNPNLSPTSGTLASENTTVSTAYDLEGPEALLAITDQRDPMTTSMESMAAQEVINDQVNQTGVVDFGILKRIQKATGLSMPELRSMEKAAKSTQLTPAQIAAIQGAPTGEIMTNTPVSPSLDDEVTGIGGGSNIAVRPNPDGTTTLTAPDGRLAVVDVGQDLDEAIKVFDEVVTPIDAQTETLRLQAQEEAAASSGVPDFTSTPFTSVRTGGISTLDTPSGVDTDFVAPAAATQADQEVGTVAADGTATVAVDPNAVVTGTDLAVVNDPTTDLAVIPETTTDLAVIPETTVDVTPLCSQRWIFRLKKKK